MDIKLTAAISILVILLIAGNVYQFQNPKTINIPTGQEQIDSTAWVKKSAVADKETIIDSLEQQNQKMANRIQEQGDKIASYVSITGRLKTEVDSLEKQAQWNDIFFSDSLLADTTQRDSTDIIERTFTESRTFGNGLFKVTGQVDMQLNPCGFTVEQIQMGLNCPTNFLLRVRQNLQLEQLRDIRLDVTSTINEDKSRALVYVTSPDFENLEYESYTELEPEKKLPWFWIGLGAGVGGALILLN